MLLIPGFLFINPYDINAAQKKGATSLTAKAKSSKKNRTPRRRYKKRRSYNPAQTRATAIELIRRKSETVCELAGLEPLISDSLFVYDDSEDSEEIYDITDDIEFCETKISSDRVENVDGEEETENLPVDMETFRMLWLSYVDDGEADEYTQGGIHKKTLINVIIDWIGTPYRFGGTTLRAIDCSAFIQKVFNEVCDLTLPRTARIQVNLGSKVRKDEIEFGDLIFFHTYTYRFASHVGIYLGDGLFAHASSRFGVTVSSLESRYYSSHFIGARRLYLNDLEKYVNKTAFSSTD